MNSLESWKQLLLAESELNRALLAGDMAALAAGVGALTDRARCFGWIASSAALLAAGVAAFQRGKPVGENAKCSWGQRILNGVRLASTIWFTFRGYGKNVERK